MKPKSIIVLSGGQDSCTCAFRALEETEVVGVINFDYGQQHLHQERLAAEKWAYDFGDIPVHLVDLENVFKVVSKSALIEPGADVNQSHSIAPALPASFVPGRNLIFLTAAAALAYKVGATEVWTGVCQTDYSGYPDCRERTMRALEQSIRLGMDFKDLSIIHPLMDLSKAETFYLAYKMGCLDWILEWTHTGYTGSRAHRYEWGWGPPNGELLDPASSIRAKGWEEFKQLVWERDKARFF